MNKIFQVMLVGMIAAIVVAFVLWIVMAIGSVKITDGCLYRYSIADDGTLSATDSISERVIVKATGNYTVDLSGTPDPTSYGKWFNSNFVVTEGQEINVKVRGEVSLCQSYVTRFNPMSDDNTNPSGDLIPIPRATNDPGSTGSVPFSYIIDANSSWKTIAEVFPGDMLTLSLSPDRKGESLATQYNAITDTVINADCSDGSTTYNPICGRYSPYGQGDYVGSCQWDNECYECNCSGGSCDWCGCYTHILQNRPEPYLSDGTYTASWQANTSNYDISLANINTVPAISSLPSSCFYNHAHINSSAYQDSRYFWLSADDGAGLLYGYTTSQAAPTPSSYEQAQMIPNPGVYSDGSPYNVFLNEEYTGSNINYLQVRLTDVVESNFTGTGDSTNTGGYVINIKHTKCRRLNGNGADDTYPGRGSLKYMILDPGQDPNTGGSYSEYTMVVDTNGDSTISVPSGVTGNIWLRIENDTNDYINSTGQYSVEFGGQIDRGGFIKDILNPIFEGIKQRTKDAAIQIFKNMTCYQGTGGTDAPCTNFFTYLRAILALYIMTYGMMFLMGMVQISQMDIVVRVVKIGFVAGLMNENTFDFFNNYVFDFITSFSDEIMANLGGYSIFTDGSSTINNPLIFLDNVMTKIFLSTTFKAQMMALLGMGLNGILYFIIVFVTLIIVIIASLRAIAVYIMAYMAIAVLIGIAPLFLSFILFEFTKSLFENWARFTFRYMIEPVIVLAGLTILVQLFTIYLDIVIGYSVCWKCALAIKIPFVGAVLGGLAPAFVNVPLFCLNWFAPWGHDVNTGPMGLNFGHIAALLILAYCMWGYIEFAGKLASRIAGSMGGPSATSMGTNMADTLGDKGLKQYGLDRKSRTRMHNHNKKRVKSMIKNRDLGIGKDLSKGSDRMDRK